MIHRVGVIPVGETAIYVGVASPHRGEAIALLAEFMDRLKQDVPIWKRRALPVSASLRATPLPAGRADVRKAGAQGTAQPLQISRRSLAEIQSRCQPLPAVRVPLAEAFGRVLRETVCAPEDLPRLRPLHARRLRDFAERRVRNIFKSWTRFTPPIGNRAN